MLAAVVGVLVVRAVPVVGAGAAEQGEPGVGVIATAGGPTTAPTSASTEARGATGAAPTPPAGGGIEGTASPGAAAGAAAVDWRSVLAALDSGRRRALVSGSTDELARYVDPAGTAWPDDVALLLRLAGSGARLDGGGLELDVVRLERADGDAVRLAVRDRRRAYDVVDAGSATHVVARPWRWWSVTLAAVPSLDGPAWRLSDVRDLDDGVAP